jgi:hypothetical protein
MNGGADLQVPSMNSHGPERMMEIVTALSMLGDVLTDLIVKLASATTDEYRHSTRKPRP